MACDYLSEPLQGEKQQIKKAGFLVVPWQPGQIKDPKKAEHEVCADIQPQNPSHSNPESVSFHRIGRSVL